MPIRGRIAPVFTSLDLYLDRRMDLHVWYKIFGNAKRPLATPPFKGRIFQDVVFMIEFENSTGTK
ncbi:MAG: hypothetical protein CVU64_16805 [Deltaproteobacteria bacterium HGW-Deltaproteobacteria-21]|nr:MAG: hypothetical protein CVU64_16805 [Deltaproteobacteria bacterium HGW-Deltaproteobacteria-21]